MAVFDIQPIVATLILMIAGRGVAQLISDGQTITLADGTLHWLHLLPPDAGATPPLRWLCRRVLYPVPLDVLWAAAAVVVVATVTRRSALGLFVESVGNNAVASRYAGVNARLVKFVCYAACGVTAGVAGLLATADGDAANLSLASTASWTPSSPSASAARPWPAAGSPWPGRSSGPSSSRPCSRPSSDAHRRPPDPRPVVPGRRGRRHRRLCLLQSEAFRAMILSAVPKARGRRT